MIYLCICVIFVCIFYSLTGHQGRTVWLNVPHINTFDIKIKTQNTKFALMDWLYWNTTFSTQIMEDKHIVRHTTARTIVSLPNPKQWLMIRNSDLMMIIRLSTHFNDHHNRIGWTEDTSPNIEWRMLERIGLILATHLTAYTWQAF